MLTAPATKMSRVKLNKTVRILAALAVVVVAIEMLSFLTAGIGSGGAVASGAGSAVAVVPVAPLSPEPSALLAAQNSLTAAGPGPAVPSHASSISAVPIAPAARYASAMAYDPKDGYVVLFGGLSSGKVYNDTWKFAAGKWTELTPLHSPGASAFMTMAYDAKDKYLVLLEINQTWTFTGSAWTHLALTKFPPARFASAMTYDAKDHYIVLFSGVNLTGAFLGDTWKFVGGKWTKLAPTTSPAARAYSSMTYDTINRYVVLFGGCHTMPACTTGFFLSDTWTFRGGVWTALTPTTHPSARGGMTLVYDAKDGYVLLFGGCNTSNCSTPFSDTWKFVGGGWTLLSLSPHPPAREIAMSAYDTKTGYVVLFGGGGAKFAPLGDTWKFVGGAWKKI
jgi:hypothetical protein